MTEDVYFTSTDVESLEIQRLEYLEQCYDPITQRHIEALGISQGSLCLEVGAGRGSVATWFSEIVRPDGKVVATDIDLWFLS